MARNTKTIFKGFDYMHCDDFARLLMDMAAKGWHFKEWGAGLKFEKGEPEQAVYAVEVFTKASEDNLRPEPSTREFAEYCEAAGWKFVDAKQKFCIFKKIDDDAVALFTEEERIENACKGMFSTSAIVLLVLYGINAVLQWSILFSSFESYIFSVNSLFNLAIWNLLFIVQGCKIFYTLYAKRKLKKALFKGEKIYIGVCKDGKFRFSINEIYLILFIILLLCYLLMLGEITAVYYYLGIIVVTIGFAVLLSHFRPDNTTNILVQIGFCFLLFIVILVVALTITDNEEDDIASLKDELPLQVADYRDLSGEIEDIDIYHDENLLGSTATYFIFADDYVYYDIYRTKHDWIINKIWKNVMESFYAVDGVDCTEDWGAEQAIRDKTGTYYVRYEDVILVLDENEDIYFTTDQIDIIRDKLDLR